MDYYNLDLFDEISTAELLALKQDSKLIASGNIFIYKDTIGKPGDIFFDLKSIRKTVNGLVFDFGSCSVE
ncbi:MAG: hypothetical protein ACSHX6_14360 [Akkermansiaceae bacterium]